MQLRKALRVAIPTLIIGLLVIASVSTQLTKADPGEETTYYLLTDHLGSVDVVLDESGNVVERRDYLPYGSERITNATPDTPDTDHGFTGKELDDETGLNYYGARYYDPLIGRFVSVDPVVKDEGTKSLADILSNPQALNAYSYALNNPVKYVDPTGMYGEDVHYDLTYYLCLQSGLTQGQSKIIAYRNQHVDDNADTAPNKRNFFRDPARIDRHHFLPRKLAEDRLMEAIESHSSPAVGDALHTYQDTYSHFGLTQVQHIALNGQGKSPDNTYADVPKAFEMAKNSFFSLRLHNLRTNGSGDIGAAEYRKQGVEIWNVIASDVESYLSQEDKENTEIAKVAKQAKNED